MITEDGILQFGKHKGRDIRDVSEDYLRWCLKEITDAPAYVHIRIREELHRREHEGVLAFDFEEEGACKT